ncbi:putative protein kinase-like domain superfamily [Helianthus annuus]|uniref:Uncharacterized protein n=1 Tax=Helianthus annuus TaxID=4232 RepID=A0A251UY60_HELAN|nr:putative protein kinase-like domain superfamily [Helianthus annuus]KAJ0930609.1 putative protein kinase-like domain superfamily [Helianthus annuus]
MMISPEKHVAGMGVAVEMYRNRSSTHTGPTSPTGSPGEPPVTGQTAGLMHERSEQVNRPGEPSDSRPDRSGRSGPGLKTLVHIHISLLPWVILSFHHHQSHNLHHRYVRQSHNLIHQNNMPRSAKIITITLVIIISSFCMIMMFRMKKRRMTPLATLQSKPTMDISTLESFQYDFSIVKAATNDFSEENKLGWGEFGAVYKVWNNLKLSLELKLSL